MFWQKHKIFIVILILLASFLPELALADCERGSYIPGQFSNSSGAAGDSRFGLARDDPSQCFARDNNRPGVTGAVLNVISGTVCTVQSLIAQSMFTVYCSILFAWKPIILAALTLYIIFYATAFMFGIKSRETGQPVTLREAGMRTVKIFIIYYLITDADVFYSYVYFFFVESLNQFSLLLLNIMPPVDQNGVAIFLADGVTRNPNSTGIAIPRTNLFDHLDLLFEGIVGTTSVIAFIALALAIIFITFGTGFFISIFVLSGLFAVIMAFFRVVVSYVTSIIALSFILMFAPIFFTFLLFSTTKILFTRWMSNIISYALQPFIILVFLFVMGQAASVNSFMAGIRDVANVNAACNDTFVDNGGTPQHRVSNGQGGTRTENCGYYKYELGKDLLRNFAGIDRDAPVIWTVGFSAPKLSDTAIQGAGGISNILLNIIGFTLAWFVLSSLTAAFLKTIPNLSRELSKWSPAADVAPLGQGASFSQVTGGGGAYLEESGETYSERQIDGFYGFDSAIKGTVQGFTNTTSNIYRTTKRRAFQSGLFSAEESTKYRYEKEGLLKRAFDFGSKGGGTGYLWRRFITRK